MARIQEEITNKGQFLRPFGLNGRTLRVVNPSQNLLGTTTRMWTTFSFCFRILALTILYLFCSQNLDKLYFFTLV